MDLTVVIVFLFVYLGMIWGKYPQLKLDRTGIALLGAIALLATGHISLTDAWGAVDVSTVALLLGLMVVSAQFRLGGFYAALTRRIAAMEVSPPALLALVTGLVGLLSAVLINDIVCLAVAPLLIEGCSRRQLNPMPYLLALASTFAGNLFIVGSIANIIVVDQAHRMNVRITWFEHAKVGLPVTILTLALAAEWLWVRGQGFPS